MSRILPTSRAAARRFPLQASNRWQPPPSVALLSTSQPLCDKIRQAHPRGAYYDLLLTSPPPYAAVKSEKPPTTAKSAPATPKTPVPVSASSSSSTPTKPETVSERARIVFGSRLAGPAERAERLARIRDRSQMIAGVLVPPQPEEPENCCMSGCVDCVWDRYRDEIEGWAQASAEASRRLQAQESGVAASVGTGTSPAGVATTQGRTPQPGAVSMDDDGGGSNTNWDLGPPTVSTPVSSKGDKDFWDDELYKGLPVGIREFMKQEKRLKLKHIREGTLGG